MKVVFFWFSLVEVSEGVFFIHVCMGSNMGSDVFCGFCGGSGVFGELVL